MSMKKITDQVKQIPWPELHANIKSHQVWDVTAEILDIDDGEILVVTLLKNPGAKRSWSWKQREIETARLVASAKEKDYRVIRPDGKVIHGSQAVWCNESPWHVDVYMHGTSENNIRAFTKNYGHGSSCLGFLWTVLDEWRNGIREAQKQERGEIMDDEVSRCPKELPGSFLDWVRREFLNQDKVLIYKKGNKRGFCHYCRTDVTAREGQKFYQYAMATCPNCGQVVQTYLDGGAAASAMTIGHVSLCQQNREYGTLFIRTFEIVRSPRGIYEDHRNYLIEKDRVAIRGKHVRRWIRFGAGRARRWEDPSYDGWIVARDSFCGSESMYPDNIAEEVAGTSLQYICLDRYAKEESKWPVHYAVCAAKYPVMEFLYKKGYTTLVRDRLYGEREQMKKVHWTAKRLKNCFDFPLAWFKALPASEWNYGHVGRANRLYEMKPNATMEEVSLHVRYDWSYLKKVLERAKETRIMRYLVKQNPRAEYDTYNWMAIARTYMDYIEECTQLNLDLQDEAVLFPPSLERAHERTMAQVKYEKDRIAKEQFREATKHLARLSWQRDGFAIRPAESADELTKEGAALHHCVAGYAKRMANGETAIFLIRKLDAPDTPFFTLELQGKRVVQCRTEYNKSYEAEGQQAVKAFVDAWLEKVVNKKAGKSDRKTKPQADTTAVA